MTEILKSFIAKQQWWTLAVFDIKQRYRRSTIGPLWITLSTGIMVGSIGLLWSTLFKMPLQEYMPFFASGLILWFFISAQLNEACTTYPQFENYIKQLDLPLPIYIFRVWARNIILFAHNFIVLIVVWICMGCSWTPNILLALIGFFVLSLSLFFLSLPISALCTRYRDIPQIIQNITQVLYFFTPIIWKVESLPQEYQWVADSNPLFHIIEIIRAPLIGEQASIYSWYWSIAILLSSIIIGSVIHTKLRKKVAYWL